MSTTCRYCSTQHVSSVGKRCSMLLKWCVNICRTLLSLLLMAGEIRPSQHPREIRWSKLDPVTVLTTLLATNVKHCNLTDKCGSRANGGTSGPTTSLVLAMGACRLFRRPEIAVIRVWLYFASIPKANRRVNMHRRTALVS